jgi:hypothetical protein
VHSNQNQDQEYSCKCRLMKCEYCRVSWRMCKLTSNLGGEAVSLHVVICVNVNLFQLLSQVNKKDLTEYFLEEEG